MKALRAPVALALFFATATTFAQVKIGIIAPFSGPFAHYGVLMKAGAEAYLASQGGKLGGQAVEIIYRDEGAPNPANAGTR